MYSLTFAAGTSSSLQRIGQGQPFGHRAGLWLSWSSHPAFELAFDFAAHIAVGDLAAAVAALLAPRQRQLDLRPRAFEVDPHRHQGEAFLGGFADQALDLVA